MNHIKTPTGLRFEGKPLELRTFLEGMGEELPETQVTDASVYTHPNTITPTTQSTSQLVVRCNVKDDPLGTIGRDLADQRWVHDYQNRLRRDELYQKIKRVANSPVRAILGMLGYREVDPSAFSVGRDVLPYLRARKLFGFYKVPAIC
jgi:hypothetical protein